jgi:hypothetical protein
MIAKALLFFQLLYVVNQIHFPWETGIPGVAPTNILFLVILFVLRDKPDALPLQEPRLKKPLLYFYGALTLAFLWAQVRASGDLIADLTYLKNAMFFPLLYFLYLRCKQDEKTTRWLIIWVLVVAAVAGLEAFREGLDYGFGKFNPFRRASGPFGVDYRMSNRAGVFFGIFTPMFVSLALFLRKRKFWRIAALGGTFLLAGGVVSTYSRQSYFMVLLSTSLLLLRRSIVWAAIVGGILVALAGYLPDSVFQRVEETKQQGAHGEDEVDVSTASRWEIWEGASHMLAANPIGVGLNRFQREIGGFSSHKNMDAHNFYVLTTAECGPQGLLLFLFLIWNLFRLAGFLRRNAAPEDSETIALALGFTVSTICFAIAGFYGSPHFEGAIMGPYWALAGLLERYTGLKMQTTTTGTDYATEPSLTERFPLAGHSEPGRR